MTARSKRRSRDGIEPLARTRNKQVVRVLRIVALMLDGYWSSNGLARTLGVSDRTVRRDLNALRYAKLTLRHDGIRRHWTLSPAKGRT